MNCIFFRRGFLSGDFILEFKMKLGFLKYTLEVKGIKGESDN